ncbi:putative Adenylate cyclase; class 3 [Paratrimastix pyriformis]|uniref:Adenylate cyclase n=1 Tax=Paratrimastix pyriformis TaxID=342808 RepID=A0ABQ8U6T8_9EUKA|nr:putative Adenylate cyclase; class 3 [Paratrimastix pyriformis]
MWIAWGIANGSSIPMFVDENRSAVSSIYARFIRTLFSPPLNILFFYNFSFSLGSLRMDDNSQLLLSFSSAIIAQPSVAMLALASENGTLVSVRTGKEIRWRFSEKALGDPYLVGVGLDFSDGATIVDERAYDPRWRPWYQPSTASATPTYVTRFKSELPILFAEETDYPAFLALPPNLTRYWPGGSILTSFRQVDLCQALAVAQNSSFADDASLVVALNTTADFVASNCANFMTVDRATWRTVVMDYIQTHWGSITNVPEKIFKYSVTGQWLALLPGLRWLVFFVSPKPQAEVLIDKMIWVSFGVTLAVVLISFGAGIFLGRIWQEPLYFLREQMKALLRLDTSPPKVTQARHFREILEMQQAVDALRRTFTILFAYLPHPIIRCLVEQGALVNSPPVEKRFICIFFCDVVRFTALSESLSLPRLQWVVNCFLTVVYDVIARYQGTIDKFMGDAVLAFWNAPLPTADPELHACECALALQGALDEVLAPVLASQGVGPMRVRVGLHVGEAMVGNVGSELRMDYTVLGDPVNVASRLEQLNKVLGTAICISDKVAEAVSETMHVRPLGMAFLKNRVEGVVVYELVGRAATVTPEQRRLTELQTTLVELLGTGDFPSALQAGQDLLEEFPSYIPAQIMMRNARLSTATAEDTPNFV